MLQLKKKLKINITFTRRQIQPLCKINSLTFLLTRGLQILNLIKLRNIDFKVIDSVGTKPSVFVQ